MAERAVRELGVSIRLACEVFRDSQFCYRYEYKTNAEDEQIAEPVMRSTDIHRTGFWLVFRLSAHQSAQAAGAWQTCGAFGAKRDQRNVLDVVHARHAR
jgi:hypothetical protein